MFGFWTPADEGCQTTGGGLDDSFASCFPAGEMIVFVLLIARLHCRPSESLPEGETTANTAAQ